MKRRGVKIRSQSEIQRIYTLNESYFDSIDTEEKAYILGLLYADGCNYTVRGAITLTQSEKDKDILDKVADSIGSNAPIRCDKFDMQLDGRLSRYKLCVTSKHMSQKLAELGCVNAKTYVLTFPMWLDKSLYNHFIRGYFDGDGHVGLRGSVSSFNITSTLSFCESLNEIFIDNCGTSSCQIDTRHPERNNNIRTLRKCGNHEIIKILNYLYYDSTIHLQRKYNKYKEVLHMLHERDNRQERKCNICNFRHYAQGYCNKHYYEFCGGKEKRHDRFINTRK